MSTVRIELIDEDYEDGRTICEWCTDMAKSLYRETLYEINYIKTRIRDYLYPNSEYIDPNIKNMRWKEDSEGLYVMIHGLLGHPSIWKDTINLIKEKHPEADIANVIVPEKGNCTLEESVDPIKNYIKSYISEHPDKPIALFGTSNGARIASKIEVDLRDIPTKIHLTTVAGAHNGSQTLDYLKKLRIANLIYDYSITEELIFDSSKCRELLELQSKELPDHSIRNFEFYASTIDTRLLDYSSSLPKINQNEKHYLVYGVEHCSIVNHIKEHQVDNAVKWMKDNY